ncbi:hypothetical protein M9H77_32195 [Catharanthus roseus]|uniref:Uncharacterized protein n=1 Tax=Catharanthus roseus TaxID=4058 RepID=A0ACC0A4N9_CATRO|nr:hypothetical protein M9H77_32195 [Catharanthus roseus]
MEEETKIEGNKVDVGNHDDSDVQILEKKSKIKCSAPVSLQARNAWWNHFSSKKAEIRMRVFCSKRIAVEKRQENFMPTLLKRLRVLKVPHLCRCMDWSFPSDCRCMELELLVMPKLLPSGAPATPLASTSLAPKAYARKPSHLPFIAGIEQPEAMSRLDQVEDVVANMGTKFLTKWDLG